MLTEETSTVDPYLEMESSFHNISFLIGIIGAIVVIGRRFIYEAFYYHYLVLVFDEEVSGMHVIQFLTSLNLPLILGTMMIATGAYSLLRLKGSPYGLLFVFLTLVGFTFSWYSLLGWAMHDLAAILTLITGSITSLISAYILWMIRPRIADRIVLTLLVSILILANPFYLLSNWILSTLPSATNAISAYIYQIPSLALSMIITTCWAYIFYRERSLLIHG